MAKDNKSLGKFLLSGLPPAPRGIPQIEVSFEIDVDGILKVSAQDKGTGKEQSIRITNTGGLSSSEIERMRQDAEMFADEDRRRIELAEIKNQADSLLYSLETTIKENSISLGQEIIAQGNEKANQMRKALVDPSMSIEEVKQELESFQQTVLAIGAAVYQQSSRTSSSEDFDSTVVSEPMSDFRDTVDVTSEEDELKFEFDEDETVTADYEAVD